MVGDTTAWERRTGQKKDEVKEQNVHVSEVRSQSSDVIQGYQNTHAKLAEFY